MTLVQPFVQVGLQAESQAVRSLSCKTVCGYALYMPSLFLNRSRALTMRIHHPQPHQ